MRTREEIEKEHIKGPRYSDSDRILEILLDIRDLLNKPNPNIINGKYDPIPIPEGQKVKVDGLGTVCINHPNNYRCPKCADRSLI